MVQVVTSMTPPTGADPTESTGNQLFAAIWTLTGLSALFIALRFYTKIFRRKGLWWDDWILLISWCLLFAESNVNTANIKLGFGHHIWAIQTRNLEPMAFNGSIAQTLTLLAETLSKTAFAVTLLRITDGKLRAGVWFCIGSLNLLLIVSLVLNWTLCIPVRRMWNPTVAGKCMPAGVVVGQTIAFSVYSGVVDIVLSMLPWKIIWGLKMRTKEKMGVGVAMSMGVLAGIAVFIKCAYVPRLQTKDFPYNGSDLIIWGNTETALTIIASTIPVLRALFAEVRIKTGKSSALRSPRAPSCVLRRSMLTPLGPPGSSSGGNGMATTANFYQCTELESGHTPSSRKSLDSLADLEAPITRSSFEKRQHRLDVDRTAVCEARIVSITAQPVRQIRASAWPLGR